MEDDVVVKDRYERTFYGSAYETPKGWWDYIFNAQPESTLMKKAELERAGLVTTPTFIKTYWYNHT